MALVRAVGARALGCSVDADVLARQVEAQRQVGLGQQAGARGLGDDVAVDLDPDRPRAPADVDAMERIARVALDPLVLLYHSSNASKSSAT